MRIIGHMVTRNEAGRYLEPAVRWLEYITDAPPIVYDDRSDDDTIEVLRKLGAVCSERPDGVPSFAENEGAFRWMAWQFMEDKARPTRDDWILCVDADEFIVADQSDEAVHEQLRRQLRAIDSAGVAAVAFQVHETFDVVDDVPQIRTDGWWGAIEGIRLVRWRPDGQFDLRREAGGSIPRGWGHTAERLPGLGILHLGYARPDDRVAKSERYRNGNGHSSRHVRSILEPPRTVPWRGTSLDTLGIEF